MDLACRLVLLRENRILQTLAPEEMERVATASKEHLYLAGQTVYLAGERAQAIYFLKTGSVQLSRVSPEGKEKVVSLVHPGDMFGELLLAPGLVRRKSQATALEESLVCSLRADSMMAVMMRNPALALEMARTLAQRVVDSHDEVERLSFQSAETRVVEVLLGLAEREPGQPDQVSLKVTHEHLARVVGASRETVTGVLGKLRREGALDFSYGSVQVKPAILRSRLRPEP